MHRSRLAAIVIDSQTDDIGPATTFWSQALGSKVRPPDADWDGKYDRLETPPGEPQVLVQKVAHPSRVHIDIETDDIEAEVTRLEKLGARRVQFVKRWWVMEAPTGQRFCVVRPQRADLATHGHLWDDDTPGQAGG